MHQEAMGSFYPQSTLPSFPVPSADAQSILAHLHQVLGDHLERKGSPTIAEDAEQASSDQNDGRKHSALLLEYWVSQAYAERRLRDRLFNDPALFGEPAWDTLLDIAHAEAKGERLDVTSACIGSCAPSTTALRWLKILEDRGLVRREADESDARRSFVRLTQEGRKRVEAYFQEVKRLRSS